MLAMSMKCIAEDKERACVTAFGVFHGTHTDAGGPAEPTGKSVSTDYVYVMHFEDGRITSMEKIWNDGYALQQLGWA